MKNIFCVDLEEWYHQKLVPDKYYGTGSTIEKNTDVLLKLFAHTGTKATFFCVGQVVEEHPELIRRIREEGHEIASHSYAHKLIYEQEPEEFEADLKKSKELIIDACGVSPKGYRAPSWSVTEKSLWALDILKKLGFTYSSSIFPTKNFLYGIPDAPPYANTRIVNGEPFLEIPPSTFKFLGKRFGFSGGFYFRALPAFMIKHFTNSQNKAGYPVVYYLHPVEIDRGCKRVEMGLVDKIITYYGLRGCFKKLTAILKKYEFTSIEEYFGL